MNNGQGERDLAALSVRLVGQLAETGEPTAPYVLIDPAGAPVLPVSEFFRDLLAAGRPAATLRSYGMDLLRWWRFLHAVGVRWDQATRVDARDFSCWIQLTSKPRRGKAYEVGAQGADSAAPPPNPITGKPALSRGYAATTIAHSETVLRSFYDFHRDAGTGPILNPFPLDVSRRSRRAHAHHNPMDNWSRERIGRYRPRIPQRIPKAIPDEKFNALFAALRSNRDRALVALWVSSGVRASELLGMRHCDVDPGQQLITVVRKGTRIRQQVPASADSFVWLRLYQEQLREQVAAGRTQPVWWTLRRPYRPLTYHAAHRMFERANKSLGSDWTLHDLRHSAAKRMANDPKLALTDVQQVMGHARLTTTEVYLTPDSDEVIAAVLAHHALNADQANRTPPPPPAPGYDPHTLDVLFGRQR